MGTPHLLTPQQLYSHCKLVQSHQKQQLQFKALENLSHFTSRTHSCCSRAQSTNQPQGTQFCNSQKGVTS